MERKELMSKLCSNLTNQLNDATTFTYLTDNFLENERILVNTQNGEFLVDIANLTNADAIQKIVEIVKKIL